MARQARNPFIDSPRVADKFDRVLDFHNPHLTEINSVVFSSDGALLASCSDSEYSQDGSTDGGEIAIWEIQSGDTTHFKIDLRTRKHRAHAHHVSRVAFSPDGKLLCSTSCSFDIKVWNVTDTDLVQVSQTQCDHNDVLSSIAFSSDGSHILSTHRDGYVKVWKNSSTGEIQANEPTGIGMLAVLTYRLPLLAS